MTVVLFLLPGFAIGQHHLKTAGTVDRVLNVPVYLFSYPVDEYIEVGSLPAVGSMLSVGTGEGVNIQEMTRELVFVAKRKMEKGKVEEFDAIIINPENYSGILIRFTERSSRVSEVARVRNVPVFMYAYPELDFEEVDQIVGFGPEMAVGSNLSTSLNFVIGRGKRRVEKGKISEFDGLIYNPNDGSYIFIKFKEDRY